MFGVKMLHGVCFAQKLSEGKATRMHKLSWKTRWKLIFLGMLICVSAKAYTPMGAGPVWWPVFSDEGVPLHYSHLGVALNLPWRTQKSFPASSGGGTALFASARARIPLIGMFEFGLGAEYGTWFGHHAEARRKPFVLSFPLDISMHFLLFYTRAGAGVDFFFQPKEGAGGYGRRTGVHPIFQLGFLLPLSKRFCVYIETGYPYLLTLGSSVAPFGSEGAWWASAW